MSIEKIEAQRMRDFEAWCDKKGHFALATRQLLWPCWRAALDSVVIELPPSIDADGVAEHFNIDEEGHDMAVEIAQMVNGAISACGSFIKAAGLQVKP